MECAGQGEPYESRIRGISAEIEKAIIKCYIFKVSLLAIFVERSAKKTMVIMYTRIEPERFRHSIKYCLLAMHNTG